MARRWQPQLSDRISRLGPVVVVNERELLLGELDDSFTEQARLAPRLPGKCFRVSCPFCGDTQFSLWISHRWGERTHWRGRRDLRLAVCYNRDCLARPGVAQELCDFVFGGERAAWLMPDPVRGGHRIAVAGWPVKPPGPLVYPVHALGDDHPAVVYLRGRGYDAKYLGRHLHVGYCPIAHPEFAAAQGRITIPVRQGFACLGWQARYVGEPPDPRAKYFVMPGMDTSRVLYNFDVARKYPFVVVCAGAPGAWSFGPEAVAPLGREVSAAQTRLIASAWGQGTAVILLGGDARAEAQQAHDALAGAARRRVVVSLPAGKGPGDFPREALRQIVFDAARQQGADLGALPVSGESDH
jgi:hypothetical protein